MNVPIIRLEVQGMKRTMQIALMQHSAQMDQSIQGAVEEYCTPENIDAVVRKTALDALDAAVREEVRSFFGFGQKGRAAVREAVQHFLDEVYPLEKAAPSGDEGDNT